MPEPLLIAKGDSELTLLPQYANRHGLVAGATGTGKTVTLQRMAECLSRIGVPVFMADVKGDLAGLSQAGEPKGRIKERIELLALKDFAFDACPVVLWDAFGEQGHPVRTTVSEMGPLLLARMLGLNETQSGVLALTFKIADERLAQRIEIVSASPTTPSPRKTHRAGQSFMDPEVEKAYTRLHEIFDELNRGQDVWHVETRGSPASGGDSSSAADVIRRKRISISTGLPPFVRSNVEAPTVPVGKQTLYFFPDVLLVFEDGSFGAVGHQDLRVDINKPQSRGDRKTPANDKVEDIQFSSASGLNELLQVSRGGIGESLKSALMDLSKFSGDAKPKLT